MIQPIDVLRGLKYRESLPEDRGMLFFHGQEYSFGYKTYEVRFPLDIVWMNAKHVVVEIAENVPPCPGPSEAACPTYGGNEMSQFVLELPAGTVKKQHVAVGDNIQF